MREVAWLFWLAAGVVFYSYLGYPALIHLAARLRPAPPAREDDDATPTVTVVIAARNEEACLEEKLRNLLALDYPRDRMEIVVGSDGSTDRTEAIAGGFAQDGVRLLALPGPRGKAAVLNDAVALARGEILVMTDARQSLADDSVRRLVACFADPTVGAVSGELHLLSSPDSPARGVGLYWRYEKAVRLAESRFDSTVGVTGAIYALRKALFKPLDPRTILDDVAVPMEIVMGGHRVLFAPKAAAFDRIASDPEREYRRKVRTLAGNYQLLALRPALLDPLRNRLFWQLVSHKLSRLAVPWCLVLLLLTSALLLRMHWFYALALGAQLAFYGLALAGWRNARRRRPLRLTSLPYTFGLLNLAAASGLLGFLRGTERATWKASS